MLLSTMVTSPCSSFQGYTLEFSLLDTPLSTPSETEVRFLKILYFLPKLKKVIIIK